MSGITLGTTVYYPVTLSSSILHLMVFGIAGPSPSAPLATRLSCRALCPSRAAPRTPHPPPCAPQHPVPRDLWHRGDCRIYLSAQSDSVKSHSTVSQPTPAPPAPCSILYLAISGIAAILFSAYLIYDIQVGFQGLKTLCSQAVLAREGEMPQRPLLQKGGLALLGSGGVLPIGSATARFAALESMALNPGRCTHNHLQAIMGGKRASYSPDEYIAAAMALYLDIIK